MSMTNRDDGSTPLVEYAAASTLGSCRTINEDAFGVFPKSNTFVVVDGCGGATDGTGAARAVVEAFEDVFTRNEAAFGALNRADALAGALLRANAEVFRRAVEDRRFRGQGATVVALRVFEDWVSVAHVGDCRLGRFRNDQFAWLTEDHSLVAEARRGGLPLEQIEELTRVHPNVITRAVGVCERVGLDIAYHPTRPLDLYLLCSDGLSGQVAPAVVTEIATDRSRSLRERCAELMRLSEAAGGHDNATVLLVQLRP
jgi:PPM family protein phosphatase